LIKRFLFTGFRSSDSTVSRLRDLDHNENRLRDLIADRQNIGWLGNFD